jgi:hypothetical protein
MASDSNIHDYMGWIWAALGVIGAGLAALGTWLWYLAINLTENKIAIKNINEKIDDIEKTQEQHEIKHNEIIEKIDESSKYIAEEFRKTVKEMNDYFDKKYTILENRTYEQKK